MTEAPTLSAAARTARKVGVAFQRQIERMVGEAKAKPGAGSVFPEFSVNAPMPPCKPPKPPRGGATETPAPSYADRVAVAAVANGYPASQPATPEGAAALRRYGRPGACIMPPELYPPREGLTAPVYAIDPPRYPGRGPVETCAVPCGVCGQAKNPACDCFTPGCPWTAERFDGYGRSPIDRPVFFPSRINDPAPHAAAPAIVPGCVTIRVPADRPASLYAAGTPVPAPPPTPLPPPPPPPFDPVRAWYDVAAAWLRCAYVCAEVPVQLALLNRVRVGL